MFTYLNTNYQNKILSCVAAMKEFGTTKLDLQEKYSNVFFDNSDINKLTTFLNLLNYRKIEPKTTSYLNSKCDHLQHFKDKRQGFEYAVDLMLGWLVEDAVLIFLKKNNISSSLGGTDASREFLNKKQISSHADLSINKKQLTNLEVFCDWSNTWERFNHADFRDQKFQSLKTNDAKVLGISPKISKGFLLDVKEKSCVFEKTDFIKGYGGKPGYTIKNIRDFLCPLREVKKQLISIN